MCECKKFLGEGALETKLDLNQIRLPQFPQKWGIKIPKCCWTTMGWAYQVTNLLRTTQTAKNGQHITFSRMHTPPFGIMGICKSQLPLEPQHPHG